MKQGPQQIRRKDDDNAGNVLAATVKRVKKTYCSILEYHYTDVETWERLLLLGSPSTCGFSRYGVVLATQWGILRLPLRFFFFSLEVLSKLALLGIAQAAGFTTLNAACSDTSSLAEVIPL
jgi:hypothetical protein